MATCPNCNHQNPDGAVQCEACYTPLEAEQPISTAARTCPQCNASVQGDATFCGQCGFNLKANNPSAPLPTPPAVPATQVPAPPAIAQEFEIEGEDEETEVTLQLQPTVAATKEAASSPQSAGMATEIQAAPAIVLMHVQTNIPIDIPNGRTVVHIGKPNEVVPPDIDVSGFPHSEVVSRVHADLRIENGLYYIEDTGSSNGTYVNHAPLPAGNRHRLRSGDRIALGKGDKVTFLFQIND
ncbi:FHA domain containing protein [[Leptolyngbya] sp. PCC 7376]|uniref:FHA domain-containing protein n=1 Tax=[Leptolyngbya] sp. PCC 7376 TaxID=111781 RepID=UPI00029F0CA2|nr:FHA domain-containing protein [[Leptolyngbya] sp. PCC 7376]AFY37368.1 FHA domain containing protein [[Leptolyngbya] sp. PCC 7376]